MIALIFFQSQAYAIDWFRWRFVPSLTLRETFSDNIQLAPKGNERSAFVTEINPGFSLLADSGKTRVNLNYRMQNVFNAGGNADHDMFHQLQFNANSEIIRNRLFLDMNSSISQQNINNFNQSNDNLSASDNRTNVYTFGVSPSWTPHFNGYADGVVRLGYNTVSTDVNQSQDTSFSDTETFRQSVNLVSGWRFSRVQWALNLRNENQTRSNTEDVKFQNGDALLRGIHSRYLSSFVQVGFSNNSFAGSNTSNENGFFYTFGARWKPSARFSLEGGIGNNSFVTVAINPSRHTSWVTTYRNNKIGTNIGDTWQTDFSFNTKRSIWRILYSEETITTQTVLSRLQTFTVAGQPTQSVNSLPTLTNEVFVSRRGAFSVSYRTGKSDFNLSIFSDNREFQVSRNVDDVYGLSASWNWRFTRRTSFFIRPVYQHTEREETGGNSKEDRFDVILGLDRTIPVRIGRGVRMNARIEYGHTTQMVDGTLERGNEFVENRITASLLLRF